MLDLKMGRAGLNSFMGILFFPINGHNESVMGYTVHVDEYRFTEWYTFDREMGKPNWSDIWGTELYNHAAAFFNDENQNLASKAEMQSIVKELQKTLQEGWRNAEH